MLLMAFAGKSWHVYAAIDNAAYGILAFSDEQSRLTNNIVRFDLVSDKEPVFTGAVAFSETATAGAYAARGYYVATTEMAGSKEMPKTLVRFDIEKGTYTTVGRLSGYESLINDMTYDNSTSTMYAVSRVGDSRSALFTISLSDGTSSRVATLDRRFFTLASTYAGQLYGISYEGDFCAIDKNSGNVSVIGHTGHYPQSFQTMEFDYSTGRLYWIASTRVINESGSIEVPESFVATIDISTGAVTRHQEFGDNQLAGLYIPAYTAAPGCPDAVQSARITPGENGAPHAVLSWVNPSKTYGGEPLKAITRVEIERDGELVGTVTTAQPGAKSSYTDNIASADGAVHTWLITAYNSGGPGVPSRISAFVGRDVPAAVAEVKVEKTSPNSARVYWNPVTSGVNGGWTDLDGLTYDVVRNPGEVAVASGITETEWFETGVEESGTYTYTVTARNSCGESAPAVSAPVILGPKLGPPYTCGFDEDFGQWTPVDANSDGNTWYRFNLSWAHADGAYINGASNDIDDWLVSNTMELEPNTSYKVSISSIANGDHNLSFHLLADSDLSAPLQTIGNLTIGRGYEVKTDEFQFNTGADIGDCNVAIHDVAATGSSYLLIDGISIEKIVDYNLAATGIIGNTKPVEGNTYAYTVTIANKGGMAMESFAVGLVDADGNTLASLPVSEPLAAGASATYQVDYTFATASTVTAIRGKVISALDEVEADNTTPALALTVMPAGTPEEIKIGEKVSTSSYHPLNLYDKFGASLNIYAASEVGVRQGRITGVKLEGNISSYSSGVTGVGIKLYMANTDRTKASDGLIPEEEMTLVYDGTFDLSPGDNYPEFVFDEAFDYSGSNLALLAVTSLANASTTYKSVSQPYYTSPLEGNSAFVYGNDYNAFDFATSAGSFRSRTGNSVITLMVQSGGASVSGLVSDSEGNPLEGAEVRIAEIHARTQTLADGSYRFDFVPNGTYTVSASMFGYEAQQPVTLIVEDADETASLTLTKLPVYKVSGRVVSPDGTPVDNAAVALAGYTPLETVTGADGTFEFADVVAHELTSVTVSKPWFTPSEVAFELSSDMALGDIDVKYSRYAPVNVSSGVEDGSEAMKISWNSPAADAVLSYDSGVAASQVGFMESVGTIVIGSVFRTPMTLKGVRWFTTSEGGPHNEVHIYVYDLDADGNPCGDMLYSQRSVANTDGEWSSLTFAEAVEAPRGCFVSVNYPGFLGLGVDNAPKTHPQPAQTYAFSTDYNTGEFMYFDSASLPGNLMIRAEGAPYSAEGTPVFSAGELPGFYRYNIRRSAGYGSSEWTLVNSEPLETLELVDNAWPTLPAGVYRYSVSSVYPDGTESAAVTTAYLPREMNGSISMTVAANSASGSAEGAKVTLTGDDDNVVLSSTVGADGAVAFSYIWRQTYILEIELPGYEFTPVEVSMADSKDVVLSGLVVKEIIANPVNVRLTGDLSSGYRFTWNESGEIEDDFEGHDAFTPESAGEVGWIYRDGDGSRTFAEPEFEFPGRTQPGSFMVFNPWLTSPSMAEARSVSLPHSGVNELACFASFTGSDDWFISPRLTYHNDFRFSFFARGYSMTYGEVIRVGYSTTDTEASSFTWLAENVDVPKQVWTQFEYTIPAAARYVALNCVSPDGFILFVDDVAISSGNGMPMNTAISAPEVKYAVMLDGQKVAETDRCEYIFTDVASGAHVASVKAVYASGESEPAEVVFGESGIDSAVTGGIAVSPNPAPGYTLVSGDFTGALLYDLSGLCVATFTGDSQRLDLTGVAPGFYILVVQPASGAPAVSVKLTVR